MRRVHTPRDEPARHHAEEIAAVAAAVAEAVQTA
jgi:hypothetical protein